VAKLGVVPLPRVGFIGLDLCLMLIVAESLMALGLLAFILESRCRAFPLWLLEVDAHYWAF
jgi:hypothetical protein